MTTRSLTNSSSSQIAFHPRPKPRPALVLAVFDDDAPHGQTPRLGTLHPSLVRAAGEAYQAAGFTPMNTPIFGVFISSAAII